MKFSDWLVDWWLRRCPHDPRHVVADFLEGANDQGERAGAASFGVQWCGRCGAIRHGNPVTMPVLADAEWTRPQPLWFAHPDAENPAIEASERAARGSGS